MAGKERKRGAEAETMRTRAARAALRCCVQLLSPPLPNSSSFLCPQTRLNNRTTLAAMAQRALTPERLVALLVDASAALERLARDDAGGSEADADAAFKATVRATECLERACRRRYEQPAVAAVGAGLVPLPSPSAEVDAALDVLARLVSADGAFGPARRATLAALLTLGTVAFASPRRAAVLARHRGVVDALTAVLGARSGDVRCLRAAVDSAVPAISFADSHSAELRALAVACAGALGALEAAGFFPEIENAFCGAVAVAVVKCPAADRPAFRAALVAQPRFAGALAAIIARGAGSVPLPGAARPEQGVPGEGALILVAALCSECPFTLEDGGAGQHERVFTPLICQQPSLPADAARLHTAAPALLGAVVDFVEASAPWCGAVAAALGPGGAGRGGSAGAKALVAGGFVNLSYNFWVWAVSVIEMVPLSALTAGAAGRRAVARLALALVPLAEALQAVAGAPPGPALEAATDVRREGMGWLAKAALFLFRRAVETLGGAAVPALVAAAPGVPAALALLSVAESALLVDGGGLACAAAASRVAKRDCYVRLAAAQALLRLCLLDGEPPRVAPPLWASPAPLLAALGGAVGMFRSERLSLRGAPATFCADVAVRRLLAAMILRALAASAADDASGDASRWLRSLAGCCPFLAGCNDTLRQARAARNSGGGGGGGGNQEAAFMLRAADAVRDTLLQVARAGGAEALEELCAAEAVAGPFEEVARVLEEAAEEGEAREPGAAAAEAAAALAAPAPAKPEAPAGPEATARACAACGAAGAPLTCAGCRGARYCGAECQRRDWRAHKAACKQRRQEMAAAEGGSGGG